MTPNLTGLIERLAREHVESILIGGVAAAMHGSARTTQDVDVVYRRTPENLRRVVAALADLQPYLRGAPPGLPFVWDERTIQRGLNFTLTTSLGPIDLLGEVVGGGDYEALRPHALEITLSGSPTLLVDLPTLIALKRAAGRPKDLDAVAELEALLDERERP